MEMMDRLASLLGNELLVYRDSVAEIRVRANRAIRYRLLDGKEAEGPAADSALLQKAVHLLSEHSVYACEEEMREGFFTAPGGIRVGVCGKAGADGRVSALSAVGSVCIRIPREKKGCADAIFALTDGNLLILSPPGMGKTTMIRDFARQLSDAGMNVAIADERRELACCREGIPALDVGCRTDVLDGCSKAGAIPMLVRACAPDWIVADEIGSERDAEALMDAARCGVRIAATAHGTDLEDAAGRRCIRALLDEHIFRNIVVLGGTPGRIVRVRKIACGVES